ncbi:hypothetical protein O0I10_005828 [Lichtheimia ornata]|uniref:Protection of telomeres protein 1 n=1 Tax=Lichtheimia ornata TaxID=688661 RepID=A0AAD7XXT6_9FUNG|nr:uncharacterized protein O0I10_005828 [Lichtheimia ornata]KAJ8658475.1 hypothetical protein O0I10_005828 [Lichtheimia ornata]
MSKHDSFIKELKELNVTVFDETKATLNSGTIYGVIDELGSIKRTQRGNMSQSFRLRDPSWTLSKYKRGVGITLFHKDREAIAEDAKVGDIFMVHDVQVTKNVGYMMLTTNKFTKSSKWCYLDGETLQPRVTPKMSLELNDKDVAVAKTLKAWSMPSPESIHPPTPSNITPSAPSNITPPTPSIITPPAPSNIIHPPTPSNITPPTPTNYFPAFKTTEEMEINKFCGYVGKVVASQLQKSNLLQLILTDYTPNKFPMANYYQSQDLIPSELLIQASLWDENATAGRDIENGDYIELHNAHIKRSKLGYMELAVRGDRTSGKKAPKVKKINNVHDDDRVKRIMQREDTFWKEVMPPIVEETKDVHTQNVHTVVGGNTSIFTVEQILDDNQVEKEYTVHAAVLDVKPRNLQSWIKKWCPKCEWIEEPDADLCSQCHQSIHEYTLMSAFLLQDNHSRRMQLQVYGEEAKAMFPNLIPIRPEEDYILALKDMIDHILSANPEKPDLYLNIGMKSYMTIANNRQFRLRDTVFHFD